MKYREESEFAKANIFGKGIPNTMFAKYFKGNSFLNFFAKPGEWPVFLANVTFEPGCRNNWHIHHAKRGGGQVLICTAGEGWYQEAGKKPRALSEGSFVHIPAGVKHWHGARKDSWFSHISVEIPGEEAGNEWLEPVEETYFANLMEPARSKEFVPSSLTSKIASKNDFDRENMFGTGMYNFMLAKYFVGRSYLKMLTMPGRVPLFFANVNFSPRCRNNWHIHHATKNGGQLLICTVGEGWYQEEGKDAVSLKAGSVVYIPQEVKHWHGAKKDSWFSHIAVEIPGENGKLEWCAPVSDSEYDPLP